MTKTKTNTDTKTVCLYTKPASLRKYSMVNQEIQTASINEKIGFSIVALPVELTFVHSSHVYVIYKVLFKNTVYF